MKIQDNIETVAPVDTNFRRSTTPARERILDTLRDQGPMKRNDLRSQVKIKNKTLTDELNQLIATDKFANTGKLLSISVTEAMNLVPLIN